MNLRVVKFGGSALGEMGAAIPVIINRIRMMSADSKVMGVFSAPLTRKDGRRRSPHRRGIVTGEQSRTACQAGSLPSAEYLPNHTGDGESGSAGAVPGRG